MSETDAEFTPLPHYSWVERPGHLPLDPDEVATALYLAEGEVLAAAERLRVDSLRLQRAINRRRGSSGYTPNS